MWKRVALCGLFLMLLWAGPATTVRAAAATVERVTVELVFPPDAQPAPPLAQRMDKSLSVITLLWHKLIFISFNPFITFSNHIYRLIVTCQRYSGHRNG